MSRWILLQFLRNLLFYFESFWYDVAHFYSFNFLTVIMRFKFYLCDPLQQLFQDWPSLTSLCLWDLWSPFLSNSFWISLNFCVKSELLIVIVTLISPLNFQSSVFPIFSLITWIYMIFYHSYDLTDANILNTGYLHSTNDYFSHYIIVFISIIKLYWSYLIYFFDNSVVCDIIYNCTSKKWKGNILTRIYILYHTLLSILIIGKIHFIYAL